MTRVLTDARLALILLAWLIVTVAWSSTWGLPYCLVLHQVVIDGQVYEGGCTPAPAGRFVVALLLMAPAPLAAVAAMFRPRGSLKRALGLLALVALELALILNSLPGRVWTHPQLWMPDQRGGWRVIVNPRPITEGHVYPP
jgi:hypothetical protein